MDTPIFSPTHTVPNGGMQAWDAPDPTRAPVSTVDAGLEVQEVETIGDWSRVIFSNGWSAWVDGSLLLSIEPLVGEEVGLEWAERYLSGESPTTPEHQAKTGLPITLSPALIGSILVVIAAFLPWVKGGGLDANSFKVPVKFLFDPNSQATSGGFSVGLVLLGLAAATVSGAMMPKFGLVRRMAAGGCLLMVTLFTAQMQRAASQLSQFGGQKVSLASLMGTGVYLALAGAVVAVMFGSKKAPR